MWSAAGLFGEADWVGTVPLPEPPHAAAATTTPRIPSAIPIRRMMPPDELRKEARRCPALPCETSACFGEA
jgi:hypothetical protein